jgi:hypothetical protein
MGNDLLRGNRLELPWFAGKVIELGRRHSIATPANSFIRSAEALRKRSSELGPKTGCHARALRSRQSAARGKADAVVTRSKYRV